MIGWEGWSGIALDVLVHILGQWGLALGRSGSAVFRVGCRDWHVKSHHLK